MVTALVIQMPKPGLTSKPVVNYHYLGNTIEEVAAMANTQANTLRQSNPTQRYVVLAGELTDEVIPPEAKIELRPAKGFTY